MMKIRILLILLLSVSFFACSSKDDETQSPPREPSQAPELMERLWSKTTPFLTDGTRTTLFATIQEWADVCPNTIFKKYLTASEAVADTYEKNEDIYAAYRHAFDRIIREVKSTTPEPETAVIWMLYNMGYVVKTPSGCFGIDLCHRYAAQFAPALDFLCITHNHSDHYNKELISAMQRAGKPVLSNYLAAGAYTSTTAADYSIGKFRIHTFITDHNNGSTNIPVTVFQIDCGSDAGNFVLLHSGDSNFRPEQFDVTEDIDLYIPRYAPNALTENNVIGKTFRPKYVLLSHILELSHADIADSRWSLELGLERAAQLDCENTLMPFWGEKLIWKNEKLN